MRRRIYEMIEKAEPEDRLSVWYDRFMILCILISIFPLCFKDTSHPVFYWADWITAGIFIVDYFLRWSTADFKLKGNLPFLRYPFTFFAVIDLVAILSTLTPLHSTWKAVRALRLPQCMKPLKILRYSDGFLLMMRVLKREKENLLTISGFAVGYILLSAMVMLQVEPGTFAHFLDAVYWASITLLTVGYGDIHPVTDMGKIVAILSSFLGVAVFALPTGIITAGYLDEINRKKKR